MTSSGDWFDEIITFKSSSSNTHSSAAAASASNIEPKPVYRAYLGFDGTCAKYSFSVATSGMMFTDFNLLNQSAAMEEKNCDMILDMTTGPMDDEGYPFLAWKVMTSIDRWSREERMHGYAKRYDFSGGAEGHAVLTDAERGRIMFREDLGDGDDGGHRC
ncbi:hypothetical protein N431DRAFT_440867 [Stipitochalara longipes BDJ]|nr:hypothetical protein N431DRAFT_440867 [Stipitochalara longipes BDJ]